MTHGDSWRIEIRSGARLHFGLVTAPGVRGPAYGGMGLIVERPCAIVDAAAGDAVPNTGIVCGRWRLICRGESVRTRGCKVLRALGSLPSGGMSGHAVREVAGGTPGAPGASASGRRLPQSPRSTIEIRRVLPSHVGFGSGTQCSLAVGMAALLSDARMANDGAAWAALTTPVEGGCEQQARREPSCWEPRLPSTWRLARLMGRSRRSAVGTIGFAVGGLIAEGALLPDEVGSQLADDPGDGGVPQWLEAGCGAPPGVPRRFVRVTVPESWRFLVVWRRDGCGMAGRREDDVFRGLTPMRPGVLERLRRLACEVLLPAASAGDFEAFCEALFEYGAIVGRHFAAFQGGTVADARLEQVLRSLSASALPGWAQSSWGPAVFIPCVSESAARAMRRELLHGLAPLPYRTVIASARSRGASIVVSPAEERIGASLGGSG